METQDEWQLFRRAASDVFGVNLDEHRISLFQALYCRVVETNQAMNLTRITALPDFLRLHLLDSLSLVPMLQELPVTFSLLDMGSGAGFPVLPLAVVFPQARLVAVESVQKKARFIAETAQTLGLNNLTVEPRRAEELGQDRRFREQFDVVTARALASLNILVELGLPFLKIQGRLLAMKTQNALATEVPQARNALLQVGGRLDEPVTLNTPLLENHIILPVRKIKATPSRFPRNPGVPAKKPL